MLNNILGERSFFFEEYLNQILRLVSSITVRNENEADRYNEWIGIRYPDKPVDMDNPSTWRYYKHLAGEKHEVDVDVKLTSIDTGDEITITKPNMIIHSETRNELLKFDVAYEQLIEAYPEMIHYINACIVQVDKTPLEIYELPNFTIVSYDERLVEKREHNLMFDLQTWLYQYQVTWAMPYYNLTDVLYLAAQTVSLSQAMIQKIFNLRLKNAKTTRAHSFHVISYLASHNRLDAHYRWLSEKQVKFLYRNILYLRNHIGQQKVFQTLMKQLFEERKISVSNYTFRQIDDKDEQTHRIFYQFVRRFLTTVFGSEDVNIYDLDRIREIETVILDGNLAEWVSEQEKIEGKFDNTLFDRLLTKDLESSIYDYTDNVRVPLAEVMINTWGYLLKNDLAGFNVTLTNYVTSKDLTLSSIDGFRLYFALLIIRNSSFASSDPDPEPGSEFLSKTEFVQNATFPRITLKHLWKNPPPDLDQAVDDYNYTGPTLEPLFYTPPRSDRTGQASDDFYIKPFRRYYNQEIDRIVYNRPKLVNRDFIIDTANENPSNLDENFSIGNYIGNRSLPNSLKTTLTNELGVILSGEIVGSPQYNHVANILSEVTQGSEIPVTSRLPIYTHVPSISVFQSFAESIYHLEMRLWFYESNISDIDDHAIMERLIMNLRKYEEFDFNRPVSGGGDETIRDFLLRVGFYDIIEFSEEQLDQLMFDILDYIYDGKYESLFEVRYIQQAMVGIFNQLSSYSVQFVNTYTNNSPILAHTRSLRFGELSLTNTRFFSHIPITVYTMWSRYTEEGWPLNLLAQFRIDSIQSDTLGYEIAEMFNSFSFIKENTLLPLDVFWKIESSNEDQNQPTQEQVRFLIENLYE